jgi:hypothetical protein
MTLIDKRCWERGCACYDSRVADETINVVQRDNVLEEVAKEFDAMRIAFGDTADSFATYVRDMKLEK